MSLIGRFLARAPMTMPTKGGLSFSNSIFAISKGVTPQNALQMTTVFACNRVIAETISSIALEVFMKTENGKEKATLHPLYQLLKLQPNPLMTSVMWREMIVSDLNTKGNHYSQIIRNGLGDVVALYPLVADKMEVILNPKSEKEFIYDASGGKTLVKVSEILHIAGLPSDNGLTGLSPISYNKRAIELGNTTQEFAINFFERGANGSGVFSTPAELSEDSYKRLKQDIQTNFTGMQNNGKPMLLEEGLKFERITINNNDSQFLETRKYQKEEIASIFRVPMHMINSLENATFSNIEHQSLEFVQYTILPWVKRIEQALMVSLLSSADLQTYSIKFNIDTLLRGDFKTRTEGYQTLQRSGVLTINEVRELENLNSIGSAGDERYIELNMTNIKNIGEVQK